LLGRVVALRRDQQFRWSLRRRAVQARRIVVASPLKLSATPVRYDRAPSLLGGDTDEVLAKFGIDVDERATLRTQGVL
jgi:crotonobetainyl-CoA:carnitine CoA-transferase CaiB-like acyl-CoA transferase